MLTSRAQQGEFRKSITALSFVGQVDISKKVSYLRGVYWLVDVTQVPTRGGMLMYFGALKKYLWLRHVI
jgi:hypothetical protein